MAGRKRSSRQTVRTRRSGRPASDSGISKEDIFEYRQRAEDRTANLRKLLEDFEATPVARKQIKDILNQLVKEGKVAHHKGNRYSTVARDLIDGTILLHRDGYGFVVP